MTVDTGKGRLPLVALIAIWSVSAIVSLPGLAISPILDDMQTIFPRASELEVQMLESLPSLLIIPFMLLAGRWAVKGNKMRLLVLGTSIFFVSGVGCTLSRTLWELIVTSTLVGVGAGMIIPLSTGLVVDYFTGDKRVNQLGISSAVNNLTLVVATSAVGYLADVEWHLAFVVYLLPIVTLLLIPALNHTKPAPEPKTSAQHRQTTLNKGVIVGLILFYFAITYTSLIVTYNTSYVATLAGMKSSEAGVVISLFFLAIMAPGLMLNRIIAIFGRMVNLWSLVAMCVGLLLMSLQHPTALTLTMGAILTGLGYGVMQPIIYDKAATNAPPNLSTLALAIVMTTNYFAILVAPFLIDAVDHLFHADNHTFAYLFNSIVVLCIAIATALTYKHNRVLGSDD